MLRIMTLGILGCLLFGSEAMAQCSTFPYTLANGTTADATQVMADLNCAAVTGSATLYSPTIIGSVTLGSVGLNGTGSISLITDSSAPARYSNSPNYFAAGNSAQLVAMEIMQGRYNQAGLAISATNTVTVTAVEFIQGGTVVGTITNDGTGTNYLSASDARLKTVSDHQTDYRRAIQSLWVGDFTWKKTGQAGFGVLAQQAYQYFPAAISKPSDPEKTWEADYGRLAPLALWGVKDVYKISDEQGKEITLLKSTVAGLKAVNDNQAVELRRLQTQMSALERSMRTRTAQK